MATRPTPARPSPPPDARQASPRPRQVLCVEDDPASAIFLRAMFRMRPHLQLVMAADGGEATALARELEPSLVMMNIQLPDCLGSELMPLLQRRFRWHEVPAVAVTTKPFTTARTAFAEVWHKPLDLHLTLQRLDTWLPPETGRSPQSAARAAPRPDTAKDERW